ncbi:hypothetical protein AURDEDRAFT_163182 [Auricularia subglabra TFB-10046 SS5]|nr:hypothetical protein AURDEDRAFT_163182 [Auricularia subglabra TFB-10046 SS5]
MHFAGVFMLAALVAGAAAQNFQFSCSSWSLSRDSHYLIGKCSAVDGSKHDAAVDLNSCIGNIEGSLRAGGYLRYERLGQFSLSSLMYQPRPVPYDEQADLGDDEYGHDGSASR